MKNKCAQGNTLHHRACNAFNFPHKFICPSSLSLFLYLSLSLSLAFFSPFTPSQTGCRQTFVKKHCFLPFQPSPSFCLSLGHLSQPLRPSYPTVCNTFYRLSSFVLALFLLEFELTCDSSSC